MGISTSECAMPIKPENAKRYPKNWKEISGEIRASRAGWRCECRGECGHDHVTEGPFSVSNPSDDERCGAEQGAEHPVTGSRVVLTVAHLDHHPENCEQDNLKAMCQRCHLAYDHEHHQQNAYETRRAGKASRDLFDERARFERRIK